MHTSTCFCGAVLSHRRGSQESRRQVWVRVGRGEGNKKVCGLDSNWLPPHSLPQAIGRGADATRAGIGGIDMNLEHSEDMADGT